MSTRCHIVVKQDGIERFLYHHCDGYPEGVGEDLVKILEKCPDHDWETIFQYAFEYDCSYEEDFGIHGDEEYLYYIITNTEKATLMCFETDGSKIRKMIFSKTFSRTQVDRSDLKNKYNDLNYKTKEEKDAFLDGVDWVENDPSQILIEKILSEALKTIPDYSTDLKAWAKDIKNRLNGERIISNSKVV